MEKGNAVKNFNQEESAYDYRTCHHDSHCRLSAVCGDQPEKEYLASDDAEDLSGGFHRHCYRYGKSGFGYGYCNGRLSEEDMQVAEATPDEGEIPGEAVLTGTNGVEVLSAARLSKEQTRARNKETLIGDSLIVRNSVMPRNRRRWTAWCA